MSYRPLYHEKIVTENGLLSLKIGSNQPLPHALIKSGVD